VRAPPVKRKVASSNLAREAGKRKRKE